MAPSTKPNGTNIADKGMAFGLNVLNRAGGLPILDKPEVRKRVERVLYRTSRESFRAATVAGRTFAKSSKGGSPTRTKPAKPRGVFDLTPTDEQQMFQEAAKEFASSNIRPAALDADTARTVPDELRSQADELGLALLGVSDELGGAAEERSAVTGVLVAEALAHGDFSLAAALLAPSAVATALSLYGDADQQQTFLTPFTEDVPPRASLALQEPHPLADPLEPRTTARREGETLIVDGAKSLVLDGAGAELLVINVLLDGKARLLIVEPGTDGVLTEDDPAMGLRAAATVRLVLDGARIPASNLLGSADDAIDAVRRSRLAWAALAAGTSKAALDQLIPYVKEREAFGEPIAYRQAVAFTISDIAIETDGLRLAVLRAASLLDQGKDAAREIAVARQLAATYAPQIGSHAVQLLGGHGYIKEYPNERWFRDLRAAGVLEGGLLV